jgi:hypothetical protein
MHVTSGLQEIVLFVEALIREDVGDLEILRGDRSRNGAEKDAQDSQNAAEMLGHGDSFGTPALGWAYDPL